jgi:hypothetical protein
VKLIPNSWKYPLTTERAIEDAPAALRAVLVSMLGEGFGNPGQKAAAHIAVAVEEGDLQTVAASLAAVSSRVLRDTLAGRQLAKGNQTAAADFNGYVRAVSIHFFDQATRCMPSRANLPEQLWRANALTLVMSNEKPSIPWIEALRVAESQVLATDRAITTS